MLVLELFIHLQTAITFTLWELITRYKHQIVHIKIQS